MELSSRTLKLSFACLTAALTLVTSEAKAFLVSEEQQFKLDIDEAKSRARDFRGYLERLAKEARERQIGADVIKREREKAEREEAKAREEYTRIRNSKPVDDETARLRLEKQWEKEQADLEKRMEEARKAYVRNRERVRQVLERDAYIDEAAEYGL